MPETMGITVVDRKKRAVVAKWGIGGLFANYPAADPPPAWLFWMQLRGESSPVSATVGDGDDIF